MARGLPRDARSIRSVGGSPRLVSPPVATAATSRTAASGPSGSNSSGPSASTVESVTSPPRAAAMPRPPGPPGRISRNPVRGSLRATLARVAALAVSRARRAGDDRPFHLTGREKRIRKGRLAAPRIACEHDDPRRAAPRLEPGVVQRAEFALAADQGLGLEAPFPRLGGRLLAMAPRRRTPPLT